MSLKKVDNQASADGDLEKQTIWKDFWNEIKKFVCHKYNLKFIKIPWN